MEHTNGWIKCLTSDFFQGEDGEKIVVHLGKSRERALYDSSYIEKITKENPLWTFGGKYKKVKSVYLENFEDTFEKLLGEMSEFLIEPGFYECSKQFIIDKLTLLEKEHLLEPSMLLLKPALIFNGGERFRVMFDKIPKDTNSEAYKMRFRRKVFGIYNSETQTIECVSVGENDDPYMIPSKDRVFGAANFEEMVEFFNRQFPDLKIEGIAKGVGYSYCQIWTGVSGPKVSLNKYNTLPMHSEADYWDSNSKFNLEQRRSGKRAQYCLHNINSPTLSPLRKDPWVDLDRYRLIENFLMGIEEKINLGVYASVPSEWPHLWNRQIMKFVDSSTKKKITIWERHAKRNHEVQSLL